MQFKRRREGFAGQILHVLPEPVVKRVSKDPLLYSLLPTDIGWYPNARYHYCERNHGTSEHILILCVKGSGWCEMDNKTLRVEANQILIIPHGKPHTYGTSESEPWSIHWLHLTGTHVDYLINQVFNDIDVFDVDAVSVATLRQLFQECYDLFLGGFVLQRLIYLSQICHYLLGCIFFNNRSFSPTLRSSRFHNLEPTMTFLHQSINKPLTLKAIADHAGLSISHFSYLFKQQTNYSPMDYFIHLKMQHACTLLTLTDKIVRDIGQAVGYEDPYYFSRIFTKIIGKSPTTFRQQLDTEILE